MAQVVDAAMGKSDKGVRDSALERHISLTFSYCLPMFINCFAAFLKPVEMSDAFVLRPFKFLGSFICFYAHFMSFD